MEKKKELAETDELPVEKNKEEQSTLRHSSDLPVDIILLISSKIPSFSFFDMVSMKGVCSTWRIAMRRRTMTYPILLSRQNIRRDYRCIDDEVGITNELLLFSINDKRKYKFEETCGIRRRIIGTNPNGWLILYDKYSVASLFHLFLKILIKLPNKVLYTTNGIKVEYSAYKIQKAVLSADDPNRREDFIVVMSYYGSGGMRLAFWRYGNSNWSCLRGVEYGSIHDIAVCKNTIYAIRYYYGGLYLESWEFKSNSALPEKNLSIKLACLQWNNQSSHLAIASEDEIFVLICTWGSIRYRPYKWDIYKLGSNRKVNSLDGRALFLSFGDPVILPAIHVERLGFKPNSIYYTEKGDDRRDLRFFCLDDSRGMTMLNASETFCDMGKYKPQQPEPLVLFLLSI